MMDCPKCGYAMTAFEVECPRCKAMGGPPGGLVTPRVRAAPPTSPAVTVAILSLAAIVALGLFIAWPRERPERAQLSYGTPQPGEQYPWQGQTPLPAPARVTQLEPYATPEVAAPPGQPQYAPSAAQPAPYVPAPSGPTPWSRIVRGMNEKQVADILGKPGMYTGSSGDDLVPGMSLAGWHVEDWSKGFRRSLWFNVEFRGGIVTKKKVEWIEPKWEGSSLYDHFDVSDEWE